ncbi:MAG: cell envelope-related transcriptional attenuator [Solirubrobacterales bacterium]|nr:cell envelope-related transcriptional attenuator [Solirubrobacterales bacterium]
MSSEGDERPPERPGDDDAPEQDGPEGETPDGDSEAEEPPPDAEQEPEREAPEYTVYGKDGDKRRQPAPKRSPKSDKGAQRAAAGAKAADRPDYKVYKSRPGLRDRFRKPDLAALRKQRRGGSLRDRAGGGGRRWLRWILIAIGTWILISFVAFALSAQIQKGKLDDSAKQALEGGPDLLAGQNILILGGDRRGERQSNASGTEGQGPPRADTIIVLHASLTSFRKLSIPRDTYAAIPDCGSQKINASLACNTSSPDGNPASTIRTVSDFLGIPIHHVVIIDFDGFSDFINTLGGIEVDIKNKVCGDVDGGKSQGGVSLKLPPGEHTLEGDKALALARIRVNECDPSEDDTDRAARQQIILNGIKGRLTDPLRLPYNFIKGPWIGWNAPKAFISDMGGFTLPQLALAAVFGGSGDTNVLTPTGAGPGGSLSVGEGECRRAVEKLTGGEPREDPLCSP